MREFGKLLRETSIETVNLNFRIKELSVTFERNWGVELLLRKKNMRQKAL